MCAPNDARSVNAFARESVMSVGAYERFHWRWHNERNGSDLLLGLDSSSSSSLEEVSKAMELFSRAVKLHPMIAASRNGLAMTLVALGRSQEALEHFKRSNVLKPKHELIANRLGNVLAAMGRFDDAANVWIRAAKFKPSVPEHFINAGVSLARAGKYENSIKILELAFTMTMVGDESHVAAKRALNQVKSFVNKVS